MQQPVSRVIAEFFKSKGMKHAFGIIGSGNAHIFDQIQTLGFTEIVCVHHEQAATMALQTYYRTSGTITAALLTTGAGSLNGVTGVVSAWADSVPCLVVSSNENSKHTHPGNRLRMWGVQGFDSIAMVEKVTKYAVRVMDPRRILYELQKAYCLASTGRPGPCWIDVPMNVQSTLVELDGLPEFDPKELPVDVKRLRGEELQKAVAGAWELMTAARRPLLWLGHGIRLAGAQDRIGPLLDRTNLPALVSWAGIDMVDSDHPRLYGRAGVYGQRAANFILQNCDCLLTIGTRLAIPQVGYDVTELARGAKVVVVDIDTDELQKYEERYALSIGADAREFLDASLAYLKTRPATAPRDWTDQCDDYRERYPWVGPEHADSGDFINSYRFMDRLIAHLKADQVVVTDMGTALLSGHQVLKLHAGQRLMTSTGLGEMGYGLPGAIGASFARNRGEVLCLNCDGGMMMNLQELQTVAHHRLPIKLVIFNNDGYLMIKHTQKAICQGRYTGTDRSSGVSCPDYSALAKAFGFPAYQIRTWKDFDEVVPQVQRATGPVICEVFMHPEQLFVPKLGLSVQADGTIVSPPLEDLSPFLPREELRRNMIVAVHPKSDKIKP
ncbi:MAG: thiamine pyrophosphate-binding protein [Candidatus Wallbacteria bacterium]|nr:thiamine pyrophosphate-binding protein [Candidatus Wallbacteria bacterium]